MITLDEISRENIYAVLALDVAESQRDDYPRSNAYSIAEGHFPPDDDPVWMRAICMEGDPVGFMMTSEIPERGEYFLWRMMIDERYQGRGYGTDAVRLLIKRIEDNGNARVLLLSHLKANTGAGRFYQSLGFAYTGEDLGGGDLEMSLRFDR
jgi:diamine N-acetyltransferase